MDELFSMIQAAIDRFEMRTGRRAARVYLDRPLYDRAVWAVRGAGASVVHGVIVSVDYRGYRLLPDHNLVAGIVPEEA